MNKSKKSSQIDKKKDNKGLSGGTKKSTTTKMNIFTHNTLHTMPRHATHSKLSLFELMIL